MARRLIFAVLWLVVFDQFVPSLLSIVEKRRYEGSGAVRAESSDIFAIGPLVSYLREHPRSDRRRAVFLGNSIMYGYGLAAEDAVPAQFERLQPDTRALNMAVNGFETGNSYLISKAIIDSVNTIFVQTFEKKADPKLPSLIPVSDADIDTFVLTPPDPVTRRLEAVAGVWRLYRDTYRIQAALFGTSTGRYIYLHKRELLRRLIGRAPVAATPSIAVPEPNPVTLRAPRSTGPLSPARVAELRQAGYAEWALGELARAHRKRVVLLQMERYWNVNTFDDAAVADFNAAFAPFAEIVIVGTPDQMTFDTMHLTAAGCAALADALVRHEREEGWIRR